MALNIRSAETERLAAELEVIAMRCADLPVLDDRSAEQVLGYDQRGLPG